jgi:signal transduction histidine kinase
MSQVVDPAEPERRGRQHCGAYPGRSVVGAHEKLGPTPDLGPDAAGAIARELLAQQESERLRLARALHDGAAQALTALLIELRLLDDEAHDARQVRGRVRRMREMTVGVLTELRNLAADLRPGMLDQLGLREALAQQCDALARETGLSICFDGSGLGECRLDPVTEISLYRIVLEAVTHTARHAAAERVDVLLERRTSAIVALVRSDGRGVRGPGTRQTGKAGALPVPDSIRERAAILGGRLMVETEPGRGTTIFTTLPYADSNSAGR